MITPNLQAPSIPTPNVSDAVTVPKVATPSVKGAIPTKIDVNTGAGIPGGFSAQNTIEDKSKALNSAYSSQLSQVQAQKAMLASKLGDPKYDQEAIKTKLESLNKTEASVSKLKNKANAMKSKGFSTIKGAVPNVSVPKVNVPSLSLPSVDVPVVPTVNVPSVSLPTVPTVPSVNIPSI
jgi:hypothetical protein